MTKYDELRDTLKQFNDYEADCREFFSQLREELANYLGCPSEQIRWLRFTAHESDEQRRSKGVERLTSDRFMALYTTAFYGAKFSIKFGSDVVDLPLRVKRAKGHFVVRLGREEWKVQKDNPGELRELVEHLFDTVKEHLETELKDLVQQRESKLGFPLPHDLR